MNVEGVTLRKKGFSSVILQHVDPQTNKPIIQAVINFADPKEAAKYAGLSTVTLETRDGE